jgi:hypothetical protein
MPKCKSCFVVLWSSPFGDTLSSSANLVLSSCGPLHLEIPYAHVQILFCGPVVLSIWRYNKLKCKSCFVVLWSSQLLLLDLSISCQMKRTRGPQTYFALRLIISRKREDHRTTKQDWPLPQYKI